MSWNTLEFHINNISMQAYVSIILIDPCELQYYTTPVARRVG